MILEPESGVMDSIIYYLRKAAGMPPPVLFRKAKARIVACLKNNIRRYKALFLATYAEESPVLAPAALGRVRAAAGCAKEVTALADLYCEHYFDLLGSGWVKVEPGMAARGLEGHRYRGAAAPRINRANAKTSAKIAARLSENYRPIDWQIDFKSGFRWSEATWHGKIRYGYKPGVDVKVPWEIARMQHLAALAWAYGAGGEAGAKYLREFRDQLLDFIARNPPGFGVNWRCTMDVGIRAANWLVAYDLFNAQGACFDQDFIRVFSRSVYEHGKHCYNNLEWSENLRSNHYLSDIAGLLFCALHLEATAETDLWLTFAARELTNEMKTQFYPDGGNFEASTSYHRLSTEIMLYCAAFCLSLPAGRRQRLTARARHGAEPPLKPPCEQEYDPAREGFFPVWFWERLEKACEFTLRVMKPDGTIPQFGDNDSGRFLKLQPSFELLSVQQARGRYANLAGYGDLPEDADYYDENILDHRHLLAVGGALFARPDFSEKAGENNREAEFVRALLAGRRVPSAGHPAGACHEKRSLTEYKASLREKFGEPLFHRFAAPPGTDLTELLTFFCYPDFGLYVYKSPALYLAARCGATGQNGNGGHAHNDQLAIELAIAGKTVVADPGTYLYTPLPERRNQFRSTRAHFTPRPIGSRKEQNSWQEGRKGLFGLRENNAGKALCAGRGGFLGTHQGFGVPVYRLIEIKRDAVEICDFAERPLVCGQSDFISRGYGKWEKNC